MFIAGHIGLSLGVVLLVKRVTGRPATVCLGWVALFALLPDIIDKPLGLVWMDLNSRRLFAHSLLFMVATITMCRIYWPEIAGYSWLVPGHLLLDGMWDSRFTLLFPLHGLRFDPDPLFPEDLSDYFSYLIWKVSHNPELLIGEAVGLIVIVLYLVYERRRAREPQAALTAHKRGQANPSPAN
jgi:hypothetical protein